MISIVIPVHNEEKNIEPLYKELKDTLDKLKEEYEIIFVNDGSTDKTLEVLKKIKAQDKKVRVLNMDRNRGEAAALTAGFFSSKGDIVVSMDGDGQNDPSYIPKLIEKLKEGYSVVSGYRKKRKEPFFTRRLPSAVANRLIALVTGIKVRDVGCSLKAYRSHVVKKIQIPHGFHRFIPAIFGVKNEEVAEVEVIDRPRLHGKSHYNITRTFEVIRELLTFPFVVKDPECGLLCVKRFLIYNLFLFLLSLPLSLFMTLILLVILAINVMIWKNASRFLTAQREGVFDCTEL